MNLDLSDDSELVDELARRLGMFATTETYEDIGSVIEDALDDGNIYVDGQRVVSIEINGETVWEP